MTDPTDPASPAMPPIRRRGTGRLIAALVMLALIGTGIYLVRAPALRRWHDWHGTNDFMAETATAPDHGTVAANPGEGAATPPPAPRSAMTGEPSDPVARLQAEITALQTRVAVLEARTASPAAAKPQAPAGSAAASVALAASDPVVSALATRLDALGARQDRLDASLTTTAAALQAAQARLAATAGTASETAKKAATLARLGRLMAAEMALNDGRPLGAVDGAPPAVARFATVAPPTEADLRLAFPRLAARARDARPPEGKGGAGFWRGIERRLLNLVTLRHGTRLVIGRQAAVTIEAARLALAAGDLSDATKNLMTLTPPEATVFNDWLSQAQALLAARAALAQMIGAA